jgi:hypothetical protein
MKLKQLIYLVSLTSLILFNYACSKKDLPEIPYENNPVFNVVGTINNVNVDLHAGENNALMLPSTESLNNVEQFTGRLSDGETAMTIRIFDTNIDIPALSGNFVEMTNYQVGQQYGTTPLLKISPGDFSNYGAIDYITWNVDGVQQTNSTLIIYEPGKYTLCAEIYFNNGEEASVCNSAIVGYETHADFVLNWDIIQNNEINALIEAPDNNISSVKWYIDNVFLSDSTQFNLSNIPNNFILKAEVQFQNGVIAERKVYVNKSYIDYSIEDFILIGQESTLEWDTAVTFTIEKNGITYQSINGTTNSAFNINAVSDYQSNADGSKVKLLKGTLDAPFLNTSNGTIVNGTFEIEIGVGY